MAETPSPEQADEAAWRADPRWRALYEQVAGIAADFAEQRAERQRRRELDPADFDRLRRGRPPFDRRAGRAGRPLGQPAAGDPPDLRAAAPAGPRRLVGRAGQRYAHPGAERLAGHPRSSGRLSRGLASPATPGLPDRPRRRLLGHDRLRAGQRWRFKRDQSGRPPCRRTRPLLAQRSEALRQRFGHLIVHDHDRDSRRRDRAGLVLSQPARRSLGRLTRVSAWWPPGTATV